MSQPQVTHPCVKCYHFTPYHAMCGREKVPSWVYGEITTERYAHAERRAPSLRERIFKKRDRCGPEGKYFRQSTTR